MDTLYQMELGIENARTRTQRISVGEQMRGSAIFVLFFWTWHVQEADIFILDTRIFLFCGLTSRFVFSRGGDLEAPEENGYLVPNPNMTDIKVDVR